MFEFETSLDLEQLPADLYRAEQVRELDRTAIAAGIPGITLMRRAGEAVFDLIADCWPEVGHLSIWCGAGNNGGDGYIVAALAQRRGYQVQLVQVGEEAKLQGDAKTACTWAQEQGVVCTPWAEGVAIEGELVVDALLGTGLSGEVKAPYAGVIEQINASGLPVVAVDIPSGLCSDTGSVLGVAIDAEATVTFIGVKQGLLTGAGPAHIGELVFDDLDVPETTYAAVTSACQRVDWNNQLDCLSPRRRNAHKGDFGRVLIVGGNAGMGGAGVMAAEAAARCGAGLVSLATHPDHVAGVIARRPEVMTHGVSSGQDLEGLLAAPDVIVLGPGLGQSAWSEQMVRAVLASDKLLVVDADALNLISTGQFNHYPRDNWVLTPHPGEAARLLGCSLAEVQADRFAAVTALQKKFGGVVLLKGAGTLICAGEQPISLCSAGNPGMATGGMGDVLSGVLAALVAQGVSLPEATAAGVALHAGAADLAAIQYGERGLLATDLMEPLRQLVNQA